MKRQQFRNFVDTAVVELLEGVPDGAVISVAMPFEQAPIGGFLRERAANT